MIFNRMIEGRMMGTETGDHRPSEAVTTIILPSIILSFSFVNQPLKFRHARATFGLD